MSWVAQTQGSLATPGQVLHLGSVVPEGYTRTPPSYVPLSFPRTNPLYLCQQTLSYLERETLHALFHPLRKPTDSCSGGRAPHLSPHGTGPSPFQPSLTVPAPNRTWGWQGTWRPGVQPHHLPLRDPRKPLDVDTPPQLPTDHMPWTEGGSQPGKLGEAGFPGLGLVGRTPKDLAGCPECQGQLRSGRRLGRPSACQSLPFITWAEEARPEGRAPPPMGAVH